MDVENHKRLGRDDDDKPKTCDEPRIANHDNDWEWKKLSEVNWPMESSQWFPFLTHWFPGDRPDAIELLGI